MTCEECTEARARQWHGIYRANCQGCVARAFARSRIAFDAKRTDDGTELRAALAKAMPETPIEAALRMVWRWWRYDHAEKEAT